MVKFPYWLIILSAGLIMLFMFIANHGSASILRRNHKKLIGLELLRCLCAFSVLLWHYASFGQGDGTFARAKQPFYAVLHFMYDYGLYSVMLFWSISGFVFFWKYNESVSKKLIGAKHFFVLRFSRLYPLHIVTLVIVAVLQAIYFHQYKHFCIYKNNDFKHFILQLFFAGNWVVTDEYSFNGPVWSISLEVLVYLIFFLSLRFFGNSPLIVLIQILTSFLVLTFVSDHEIFSCILYFFLGALASVIYSLNTKYDLSPGTKHSLSPFLLDAGVFLSLFVANALRLFHMLNIYHTILISLPCALFLCVKYSPDYKFSTKIITLAGNLTYASYLLHFPVQLLIVTLFKFTNHALPWYKSSFFLVYIALVYALSFIVYKFFEMPAQNSIRKYFRKFS